MVPDVAKTGRSFKGAFAYYLHDKRQDEAAAHPATAERVAWTETRNLATDDPETAKRIMIATAQQADELKAAAGVKATGRKSTAHVYAYALSWHPDEAKELDRAEMVRAADASLKALGADHLQAVIVAHADRAHPHVHVIVNRVDPESGKMFTTSNDHRKLSEWANAYERERGQIVTPDRDKKREAREEARAKKLAEANQPAPAAPETAAQPPKPEPRAQVPRDRSPAARLSRVGEWQARRHKAAWPALSEQNKAAREAIYSDFGDRIKATAAQHKELARPLWAQHFRTARQEAERFKAREGETLGRIANALEAAKGQMARGTEPGRGLLSLTFANVLNADRRVEAFTAQQDARRAEVAQQLRHALDTEIASLKAARADALAQQREAFGKARADLIERQDLQRAQIREAWRHVPGRRSTYRARPDAGRVMQEQEPVRDDFDKAKRLAQANPAPHPTEKRFVSQPAPAPSPAGAPPQQVRKVQDVPKRPEPVAPAKPLPNARRDWTKATPTPAPAKSSTTRQWEENKAQILTPPTPSAARDWNNAPKPSKETKPLPKPDKDRGRDW